MPEPHDVLRIIDVAMPELETVPSDLVVVIPEPAALLHIIGAVMRKPETALSITHVAMAEPEAFLRRIIFMPVPGTAQH